MRKERSSRGISFNSFMGIDTDVIEKILYQYLTGVAVYDISDYFKLSPGDVNDILDAYAPHLE